MRVLFAGSPDVALPGLRAILEAPCDVVGVITQPAQPVGRKRILTDTPVGRFAKTERLALATPRDTQGILECVREWKPDIAIVVAYGRLFPDSVLEAVPQGWWNVHFSLLPRWRGAAPVPHAILAGDDTTGVTLFRLDSGLDTGAVALTQEHHIAPHDTATTLLTKLSEIAVGPVVELVARLGDGDVPLTPQSGQPSFPPNLALISDSSIGVRMMPRFIAGFVPPLRSPALSPAASIPLPASTSFLWRQLGTTHQLRLVTWPYVRGKFSWAPGAPRFFSTRCNPLAKRR